MILGLFFGVLFALLNGVLILVIREIINLLFPGATHSNFDERMAQSTTLAHVVETLRSWLPRVKAGEDSANTSALFVIAIIPIVMFFRGLCGYLNVYLINWAAVRAVADIRRKLFNHLQSLPLSFFSQARTGDLISRITSDVQALYWVVGNSLASIIKDPITVVVALPVRFVQQPLLTTISVVVLPTCVVPIIIYGRKVRKSARAMQGHLSELSTLVHESFTGNRIIKAYNLEEAVSGQFRQITGKFVSHVMRVIRSNELPSQLTEFLAGIGVAMVLGYGVIFIMSKPNAGPITGDFVAFVMAFVLMYPSIKSLTRIHNQLLQAQAASQRVFELLALESTIVDPPNPVPLKAAGADILFDHVDFDYGDKPVLRDIDLTVKAGQVVALVGGSGSGKTTLVNLLPRFYDPQRGAVRIGSVDLRQVAIRQLREQIALVTQETILFHDTIRYNIAVGRPGASNAEIEAAARHANAHEFIVQKPQGYDTIVGEKGVALSGGQRQRIAIARAILKDAPILILDEATSSLDAESERAVQAELEKLMQGRTTICIAHRLSTIQNADRIVVLSEGRIVETGTHADLIRRGGAYQRLYEIQFQG
jgi:subfamily B ATP-binding cassette protein MsbA